MNKIALVITRFLYIPLFIGVLHMATTDPVTKEPIVVMKPVELNPPPLKGDLYVFLERIAKRESSNNPKAINRYGYMGKYQFGGKTLWSLGAHYKVSRREFLGDVALQDSAMITYLKQNRERLKNIIIQYDGKWYNGVYITESGILAGAHLVGPNGILAYFDPTYTIAYHGRNIRPRMTDGNGTHVREYINEFSGYMLDIN